MKTPLKLALFGTTLAPVVTRLSASSPVDNRIAVRFSGNAATAQATAADAPGTTAQAAAETLGSGVEEVRQELGGLQEEDLRGLQQERVTPAGPTPTMQAVLLLLLLLLGV